METLEMDLETEVEKSEINFDFLQEKEEPKTLEKAASNDWICQETIVVVVKTKGKIPCDFSLCGKKLVDWVCLATSGCKQVFIDDCEDILSAVKPFAEKYNFVAVFYSDTPLLRKSTFIEVMNYFSRNRMNVLTLSRGFVFRSEFLKNAKMLMSSAVTDFDKEDFCVVDDEEKVSLAFDILNERILSFHKQNGVVVLGESFIDADVEIEEGAVIYPNNVIKGQSYIGKNVVLESGNQIEDSIICDDCILKMSYVQNSKIEQGKTVGPFAKVINQKM